MKQVASVENLKSTGEITANSLESTRGHKRRRRLAYARSAFAEAGTPHGLLATELHLLPPRLILHKQCATS